MLRAKNVFSTRNRSKSGLSGQLCLTEGSPISELFLIFPQHTGKHLEAKRYAQQNLTNRSGGESMEYWRDRAIDKGIGEATAMLEALLDDSLLLSVACHIEGCHSTWTGLDADDPLVEAENRIATIIADLGIALIARRSRSILVFLQLPYQSVGIIHETQGQAIIDDIKADFDEDRCV